jgi:hypothetical protein
MSTLTPDTLTHDRLLGKRLANFLLLKKEEEHAMLARDFDRLRAKYQALTSAHERLQRLYAVLVTQHNAVPSTCREEQ